MIWWRESHNLEVAKVMRIFMVFNKIVGSGKIKRSLNWTNYLEAGQSQGKLWPYSNVYISVKDKMINLDDLSL